MGFVSTLTRFCLIQDIHFIFNFAKTTEKSVIGLRQDYVTIQEII